MKPKIAIVCDWLISRGGAERVIKTISDIFPHAPIFTSLYDKKNLPEFSDRDIKTSFIQKMPFALRKHYMYLPMMPYVFEQFDLSEYDIVISSSHSCAKGIITKPQTLHICYCHSPMRYCWDSCHSYFNQFGIPSALRWKAKKILHELRIWDRVSADRVDAFIANSELVKSRIWKYYRKDSTVIYPPVETEKFLPAKGEGKAGQYFLAVGRLTPYKRFDLLVETFNHMKLPLVIVGTGKEKTKLEKSAEGCAFGALMNSRAEARPGRFITFLGHVPDEKLNEIYQKATALIFPQVEDFGIIPLEAMSCGKPVIAFSEGGALETVIPGKTGLFFTEQSMETLKRVVLEFGALKWDSAEIRKHAQKFSKEIFENNLKQFIEEKWWNYKTKK